MNKISSLFFLITLSSYAQNTKYWQQQANYKMEVEVDTKNYIFKGNQEITYTNNSPDTIHKVFYHLYFNAFQPGSEMDARLHHIKDPDRRMVDKELVNGIETKTSRIEKLKADEIGFLKIENFQQNDTSLETTTKGTILEVTLKQPILPNSKTVFKLDFEGQIPIQIRRSGRNNSEGIALSMTQWYPKLAEYDFEGWHADPYIAREFYGVWGNYDVKITIDKKYTVGGTGYLQNSNEVGHGYEDATVIKTKNKKLTWHFIAPMVHDFAWAADTDYIHDIVKGPNDVDLHFLYKNTSKTIATWKKLETLMPKVMALYNQKLGDYPYKQYSFIQGGDGGMEYAMCTLMLGNGSFEGLAGTATHELGHSWFQHVLATNESKHAWMDEGFTTYIEDWATNELAVKKVKHPFEGNYKAYYSLVNSGNEQPQTTHSDRYDTNRSYAISSYIKGSIFLSQMGYLIGEDNLDKTLKKYFNDFKFKHPTPNDIKRTAEKVSGAELDWYLTDWTQTTNTIDYSITNVDANDKNVTITIERLGRMPMPIDLTIQYQDGSVANYYIPLRMMYFKKDNPFPDIPRTILPDWTWANNTYTFTIPSLDTSIQKVQIDPSGLMADVNLKNNLFEIK